MWKVLWKVWKVLRKVWQVLWKVWKVLWKVWKVHFGCMGQNPEFENELGNYPKRPRIQRYLGG